MALTYETLDDLFEAIADAIRQVEGSTGYIDVQEFPDKIKTFLCINGLTLGYDFDNDNPSDASGSIFLMAMDNDYLGTYDICWCNADGVMTNYTPINTLTMKTTVLNDKVRYSKLINVNAIPKYATGICAVQNGEVKATYSFPKNKLWSNDKFGEHLYSIGALSDIHYQYDTGSTDFAAAMKYLDEKENVIAVCAAGDLTANGTSSELNEFIAARNSYSTPFYTCNGNHEVRDTDNYKTNWSLVTSDGEYFYKEIGGDIYIFLNINRWNRQTGDLFSTESLTWLQETLERFKNQRVFLFEHVFPYGLNYFANPDNAYTLNIWGAGDDVVKFMKLMAHYKNVIVFTGHSHIKYYLQEENVNCNYYRYKGDGARFIHISSLTAPRDITDQKISSYIYAQSEGTVMDVYPNHIILRSRNFLDEKFIGVAQYILDTTPVEILDTYDDNVVDIYTYSGTHEFVEQGDGTYETVTLPAGKKLYAKWDKLEYSGGTADDATTQKVGIAGLTTKKGLLTSDYQNFSEETLLTEGLSEDLEVNVYCKCSSSSTAELPVTWNVDNFRIYYYNDGGNTDDDGDATNVMSISNTYTFTDVSDTQYDQKYNVTAGKTLYAKWDGMTYSGSDSVAEKIGVVISAYDSSDTKLGTVTDYQDYSSEIELTDKTDGTSLGSLSGISYLRVWVKSSSSSTAEFPATMTLDNFRIYYRDGNSGGGDDDSNIVVLASLDSVNVEFTEASQGYKDYTISATLPANKQCYIKWDSLEYSGSNATTEKVGIVGLNSSGVADYADLSQETPLTVVTTDTAISGYPRASSSATATFPVTWKMTNLKIYYYK